MVESTAFKFLHCLSLIRAVKMDREMVDTIYLTM